MSESYATSASVPAAPKSVKTTGPAHARYEALRIDREPYLVRARRISRLTVPALFREYGENGSTSETLPWQSLGAYCVNNITAKIVLALFPPGIPFIHLKQAVKALQGLMQMDPEERGELKAEIDKGLAAVEMEFVDGIEEDGDRFRLFDGVRHMVVGGTHGFHTQDDGKLKSIPLESFVNLRDNAGNLIEAIVEDSMAWETVPDDVKALAKAGGYANPEGVSGQPPTRPAPICVYTHILRLKSKQYRVYQEVWGQVVPGSEHVWDEDALPYSFAPMNLLKKESYGRSYAEDYEGDLQTLDGYWQLITEGAASIAQTKWLVKPGGVTNKKAFAEAANGAVLTGDAEDVTTVKAEKSGDLAVAVQQIERLETRLSKVFLLYSSIQRQGERVTAEEIVTLRRDLETALGSVYSNLVISLQSPYARSKMAALQRTGRVTKLPKGTVKMTILTGDAGLGRQAAAQALDEFLGTAGKVLGDPKILAPYIDVANYLSRGAANRSIDQDGLLKDAGQVKEEQQEAMQQQTVQQVAPEAVRQVGQMAQNSQQAALAPPTPDAAPAAPSQ